MVARLYEPQKKLSLLFKIWKQVENEGNDWQLVIVGDGPDRALYEEQVKLYGLKKFLLRGGKPHLSIIVSLLYFVCRLLGKASQ